MFHSARFRRGRAAQCAALSCAALLAWAGMTPLAQAADGAQLFIDMGCINCHARQSSSAPNLAQLLDRMKRKGDQPEALQHVLKELRGQTSIRSHQMVSDESALAILKWMAQGDK